jgi:hypothetical protein
VNAKKGMEMSQRQANLVWLRDLLEHLSACRTQLAETDNDVTIRLLTESMLRDLERCQQLCQCLRRRVETNVA